MFSPGFDVPDGDRDHAEQSDDDERTASRSGGCMQSSTATRARSPTQAGAGLAASRSIPAGPRVGWRWSKLTLPTRSTPSGSGR